MRHTEAMAELGTSGGIDVTSVIGAVPPGGGGIGGNTERTPDDRIAKKAGRGF